MIKEDVFEKVINLDADQLIAKFSKAQLAEMWEILYSTTASSSWTTYKLAGDLAQYWRSIVRARTLAGMTSNF